MRGCGWFRVPWDSCSFLISEWLGCRLYRSHFHQWRDVVVQDGADAFMFNSSCIEGDGAAFTYDDS